MITYITLYAELGKKATDVSPGRAKYRDLVEKVFKQPRLFFTKVKIMRGWVVPRINVKALMYHLEIGVGTAYTVRYGIQVRLNEIARKKVDVILKEGEREGEVIVRLQQGELWSEHGPYKVEELRGADPTPLLSEAVKRGLVIPISLSKEIREKILRYIKEKAESKNDQIHSGKP